MRTKKRKQLKKKTSSKRKDDFMQSHEDETMSQVQNRYGIGRKNGGSDGSIGNEGFSNH